jgi:hypothetical protein
MGASRIEPTTHDERAPLFLLSLPRRARNQFDSLNERRTMQEGTVGASEARTKDSTPRVSAEPEALLTADQVAEFLHVPVSWVYERTRKRGASRLPHLKLGKYLRFEERAVREFLDRQRRA